MVAVGARSISLRGSRPKDVAVPSFTMKSTGTGH